MSDLIEREYLLNIARQEEAYGYVSEHEILNAPTAEPKVGKWLDNKWLGEKCSICSWELHYINFGQFKYCPNCGAKMEGRE